MKSTGRVLTFVAAALASASAFALGSEAEAGRSVFAACQVCHDAELDPPKGPPMFGVQRRYKAASADRDAFIERMVAFVRQPTIDQVVMHEATSQLGLMGPMPLPEAMLRQIAAYVYEETFPPPCTHWEIAVRRATESGDAEHARKDRKQLERFCR